MNKKLKFIVILIALSVLSLHFIPSRADSGWDSDYDSGSSWDLGSDWDSGSSWDNDYDYDWGSSSSDWGSSSSYSGYGYHSCTSAVVPANNDLIVYRFFTVLI